MKIILINGQGGTGKTSVAAILKSEIPNSVYIEADTLVAVNPFEFGKLGPLLIKNAVSLIHNFAEEGYEIIITAGLTRNQEQLDEFLSALGFKAEIVFVWLRANKEARLARRKARGRDGADSEEHFESINKIYPDVETFDVKGGKLLDIDTSSKSIQEIVAEIKAGM